MYVRVQLRSGCKICIENKKKIVSFKLSLARDYTLLIGR